MKLSHIPEREHTEGCTGNKFYSITLESRGPFTWAVKLFRESQPSEEKGGGGGGGMF